MANQVEMVNGVLVPLTGADLIAYDALQAAWPATQAAQKAAQANSIIAQMANLTAAVVALGGTLPLAQITAANNTLTAIGDTPIAINLKDTIGA